MVRMTAICAAVLACALAGCASRGKRVDVSVEAVTTHDFNPTDLAMISEGAVKQLLNMELAPAGVRPVAYVAPVVNLTNEHVNSEAIRDNLAFQFSRSDRVDLVARDAARDEAMRELERQQGAFTDPATAQRIGKQVGAAYFVQGRLTNMESKAGMEKGQYFQFTLQWVEVETLKIKVAQVSIQKVSRRGWFGW